MRFAKTILIVVLTAGMVAVAARCADNESLPAQLAKADELYAKRQFEDAARAFQLAAKTPEGEKSYPAQLKVAKSYRSIGAYERCAKTAGNAALLATTNLQRADAHWMAGLCYGEQRGENGSYELAEQELHTALQLAPENDDIHVSLGSVLMRQHRDGEGIAELKLYLQKHPKGELASTAQALIQAPALARLLLMPEFTIKTFDGRSISNADLQGKVVLFDFWAPWCAPCRAALPHLRWLLKQYSEKQLAVISVCGDEKEETWRNFIYENAMDWPQYYDRYATMRRLFDVKNYPTYFVIDSNGVIRTKVIGVGPEQIVAVEDEVKKEMERRDAQTRPASSP